MDKLELIIEEGTKFNDRTIVPTVNERLSLKISILDVLSRLSKTNFAMNRQLFNWKKRLVSGEIDLPTSMDEIKSGEFTEKFADWLLDPLLIFCDDIEETAKEIANGLFEKGYQYVRARNDMYPGRINIDVEFEVGAILNYNNKSLAKHADLIDLFGANINLNGFLMLPIFLYDYITPKFDYEEWKKDLELEPFLWTEQIEKWETKGITKPNFNQISVSERIFNIVKSEPEGTYLFTGYFSYFLMTSQSGDFNGDYHIYHENPLELMKKINVEIPGLKLKEESPLYYFQTKYYQLLNNGELILTIYPLEFPINYIRLGYYNHTNYHGLLLFLILESLKVSMKEFDEKISNIGYLVAFRNEYLKTNHNGKNIFEILQNNSIGPRTTPFLEFKKKEWNRELTFFYRPNMEETKEDSEENNEEKNEK